MKNADSRPEDLKRLQAACSASNRTCSRPAGVLRVTTTMAVNSSALVYVPHGDCNRILGTEHHSLDAHTSGRPCFPGPLGALNCSSWWWGATKRIPNSPGGGLIRFGAQDPEGDNQLSSVASTVSLLYNRCLKECRSVLMLLTVLSTRSTVLACC